MEADDPKPEPRKPNEAGTSAELAALPLLPVGVVFTMLTLMGAGMLAYALMGQGGILLGLLGAVQTFVCSAMLGAVVRRWKMLRRPKP